MKTLIVIALTVAIFVVASEANNGVGKGGNSIGKGGNSIGNANNPNIEDICLDFIGKHCPNFSGVEKVRCNFCQQYGSGSGR